jgi:hypothetical protein
VADEYREVQPQGKIKLDSVGIILSRRCWEPSPSPPATLLY